MQIGFAEAWSENNFSLNVSKSEHVIAVSSSGIGGGGAGGGPSLRDFSKTLPIVSDTFVAEVNGMSNVCSKSTKPIALESVRQKSLRYCRFLTFCNLSLSMIPKVPPFEHVVAVWSSGIGGGAGGGPNSARTGATGKPHG